MHLQWEVSLSKKPLLQCVLQYRQIYHPQNFSGYASFFDR